MNSTGISVVTGGASGIGAACVQHLVKRGDRVVVIRSEEHTSELQSH